MYLDKRLKRRIARVFSRMRSEALLLDTDGQVLLPEGARWDIPLPESLWRETDKPCRVGGYTVLGTGGGQPLFLCLPGTGPEAEDACILSAGMVSELIDLDLPSDSREYAYQYLLREEVAEEETEAISREYGIPLSESRCVMLLRVSDLEMNAALGILSTVLDGDEGVVVEADRHTAALILRCGERDEEEVFQMAQAIENTFATEANSPVYIGVGEPRKSLGQLRDSMREARRAIEVGRSFKSGQRVFRYRSLLLERFCMDVPRDMAAQYAQALFNRGTSRLFSDVMLQTIEAFFENSLNLSETARKLFIHRNTLVYRLDKIQKTVGLDLRDFDDAATFRLLMMLSRCSEKNGKKG